MAEQGLLVYVPRKGVSLTEKGRTLALLTLRKHRLIEVFLVNTLKLELSEVHDEAELLEHVISDKLLQRIDDLLENPTVDPHGDPIPNAEGIVVKRELINLSLCEADQKLRVARILDQNPDFLQFISDHEIMPGIELKISKKDTIAEAITLELNTGKSVILGINAASKLAVEIIS